VNYDLVFAKARCAMEALAVGTAVILCDFAGTGPLVTSADFDRLKRLNFGIRTLSDKLNPDLLEREIARYDATDAAEVSRRIRSNSSLTGAVDNAVALYSELIEEFRGGSQADPAEENLATAEYLRWLTLTTRADRAKFEAILTNSPTLRLRNRIGRLPLMNRVMKSLAQISRRNGSRP
jgi:hypothetical protein